MRSLILAFEQRLQDFLEQRERLLLVVEAGPTEQVALSKLVETLEVKREEVFWCFPQPFVDSAQYAEALIGYVRLRLQALALHWEREEGRPMPTLPASVDDPRQPPAECLRATFVYLRSLIDPPAQRSMVVALLPASIESAEAFASLVLSLLEHEVAAPWCHHMRFLVCEDGQRPALGGQLARLRRADCYTPDLGHAALEGSLEDDVNDARLPLAARLEALLVLAGLDTAHRRVAQALEKYKLLHRYHASRGDKQMTALCLNGAGEALSRAGDFSHAKRYFESALSPALESKAPAVLCTTTFNLAYLHFSHQQFARAVDYYGALAKLAGACSNPALKLHALEQMGVSLAKLGRHGEALERLKEAVQLAETLGADSEQVSALNRMRALFEEARMSDHVRSLDARIAGVEQRAARAGVEQRAPSAGGEASS